MKIIDRKDCPFLLNVPKRVALWKELLEEIVTLDTEKAIVVDTEEIKAHSFKSILSFKNALWQYAKRHMDTTIKLRIAGDKLFIGKKPKIASIKSKLTIGKKPIKLLCAKKVKQHIPSPLETATAMQERTT